MSKKVDVLKVNRKEFISALYKVMHCVSSGKEIPILSYILLDDDKIVSFNGVESIRVDFNHGLKCCVPGNVFYNVVCSYNSEEIEFEEIDNKLKFDKAEIDILPTKEFVHPWKKGIDKSVNIFEVDKSFMDGLDLCLKFINKNLSEDSLKGITFYTSTDIGYLGGSDNIRVAMYDIPLRSDVPIDVLLPDNFCRLFSKLFKGKEKASLTLSKDHCMASINDTHMITKLSEVEIMDYVQMINQYTDLVKEYESVNTDILDALKRAVIVLGKGEKVNISSDDGLLIFESIGGACKIEEEVDISEKELVKFNRSVSIHTLKEFFDNIGDFSIVYEKSTDDVLFVGKDTNFTAIMSTVEE